MPRYENMLPVEDGKRPPIPISESHWRDLQEVSRVVRRRTEARTWVNLAFGTVCFGYLRKDGDIALVWSEPLLKGKQVPNRFRDDVDPINVDDIVKIIRLGRVDPRKKKAWAQARRDSWFKDAEQARGKAFEEKRGELAKLIRYERERIGMGRRFRRSVMVNGLRGD